MNHKCRIVSINIANYRAFFNEESYINLPNGENLLIYGENGSGKSSLFKGIRDFFLSSIEENNIFTQNKYSNKEGFITLGFNDFDLKNNIISNSNKKHTFNKINSNKDNKFIKSTALVSGFLDYTNLLDVYLHKESTPNLFNLIILNLLGTFIPISSGASDQINIKWTELNNNLITKARNRNSKSHKQALNELPTFFKQLEKTLLDISDVLNSFLNKYFSYLNINIEFILEPLIFNYDSDWKIDSKLYLKVYKDNLEITDNFRDILNEARLSALSICLYFSALTRYPDELTLKVLYLDDIFVGLDAGNRMPIIDILINEFKDYQIFISTYDRHWFEMANHYLNLNQKNQWLTYELYVGHSSANGINFNNPIIVRGENNYEKAVRFLHDRIKPDYPASANYFRKYLEELIKDYIPKWEIVDDENTQILNYKLNSLVDRSIDFLQRTKNNITYITQIKGLLRILLHPLSHHEVSSPIYKNELINLETTLRNLRNQLSEIKREYNFKCCLEATTLLRLCFTVDSANNEYYFYDIKLNNALIFSKIESSSYILYSGICQATKTYGNIGSKSTPARSFNKRDKTFIYENIEDAYNKIYEFINNQKPFSKVSDYRTVVEFHNGKNWSSLTTLTEKLMSEL